MSNNFDDSNVCHVCYFITKIIKITGYKVFYLLLTVIPLPPRTHNQYLIRYRVNPDKLVLPSLAQINSILEQRTKLVVGRCLMIEEKEKGVRVCIVGRKGVCVCIMHCSELGWWPVLKAYNLC